MKNKQLINFLFKQMYKLEDNKISIEKAKAFSKIASQINAANRNKLLNK